MEEYKVLITTSGLGSRLGNLTDYTNKSLVRVADKPAISYIIEAYPNGTEFIITLGHYGEHVRQFLNLAYPDVKFEFVNIDKYKGEGSSLGYSMLQCKHYIDKPFIFHASDTLIKDYQVVTPDHNYVIGCYKEESSQYRTLNTSSDNLIRINEKGEIGSNVSYIGVSGIKDFELFFYTLEKLIISGHEDTSDVHSINNMLHETEIKCKIIESENWFDIGNTSSLIKTRRSFHSNIEVLDKKDESIFFFDDFVIKFFSNSEVNIKRVKRAKKLNGLVPEILGYSNNFYKYRKAEGSLFSKSVNSSKFLIFLEWSKNNLWEKIYDPRIEEKCYDFYVDKTKKRISEYLRDNKECSIINGEDVPCVVEMIDKIDTGWLCDGVSGRFHGDFILDNIIETDNSFSLIDWRQDFAGDLDCGDVYYDLAKLNHNLTVNHDIVNKNLFDSSPENCYILTNSKLNECREYLHLFIKENGYDLNKVELLTSIIWINMAPLHEYPFNNFLFNFGKYNLYKNLKK